MGRFYITTTLPYVNAEPHMGFAMEIVHADILARYRRMRGDEVVFNTGTDEHGTKIYEKAREQGLDPQAYTDIYAEKFRTLKETLDLSYTHFIRTTDEHHKRAAQEFWKRCLEKGDIYKKKYQAKYCVGCELEKTDSELVDGVCPIHPNRPVEYIEEENYFFRFSAYQNALLDLYASRPLFVVPRARLNEIESFVRRGLSDFSISRLKTKMPWGIPVPGDDEHVMYVWFDALVNYISTIGWPDAMDEFNAWWPVFQTAGKDNLRQQAAMWQAMLMSAGVAPSQQILIHGFITSGGQKMSKSVGNVIDPLLLVKEYGRDALRFYIARALSPFEDSDMTEAHMKTVYNADLANGIGNLTSRIMKMATTHLSGPVVIEATEVPQVFHEAFAALDIPRALSIILEHVKALDTDIQIQEPFKVVKADPEKGRVLIKDLVKKLALVATLLLPVMPETSRTITGLITDHRMPETPLFVRKD